MLKRSIFCAMSRRSFPYFSSLPLMMPKSASAACSAILDAAPIRCHATEAADTRAGAWSRCSDDLLHRTWTRASEAAQCAAARGSGARCARSWKSWGHHEKRDERHDDAEELLQEVEVLGRAPGPKEGSQESRRRRHRFRNRGSTRRAGAALLGADACQALVRHLLCGESRVHPGLSCFFIIG